MNRTLQMAGNWVLENQVLLGTLFIVLNGLGILADLFIVVVLGQPSISWRTWTVTEAHPTISIAGTLAGIWFCWLVRTSWVRVAFAAAMVGHLFWHW